MLHTKHMLFRPARSKSGIATVLGMLIFIGVLFTCVIPLFLYVNKVNSYYDRAVMDMGQFDQDKETEKLDVYAYPIANQSDLLNIYVRNKCPIPVKIVRIWVNYNDYNLTGQVGEIAAMAGHTIPSINISELLDTVSGTGSFYIKVTTNKGNSFSSLTNPLYYTTEGEDGGSWSGGIGYSIHIVINTDKHGQRFYDINVTGPGDFSYQGRVVKRAQDTSCFTTVGVTTGGEYLIVVKEKDAPEPLPTRYTTLDDVKTSVWEYFED